MLNTSIQALGEFECDPMELDAGLSTISLLYFGIMSVENQRQRDPEGCADPIWIIEAFDSPAMRLDDGPTESETHSETLRFGGEKGIEHLALGGRRDTRSRIADDHPGA